MQCLLLEAGKEFTRDTYPRQEIDANSQLFWGGGIELNTDATIGLLRPKVVGGGSVVNQALATASTTAPSTPGARPRASAS